MNAAEYEFNPGEVVYVVLNENTVREATVVQVDLTLYEEKYNDQDVINLDVTYIVLFKADKDTRRVEVDQVFAAVDEALEKVREKFIPRPS